MTALGSNSLDLVELTDCNQPKAGFQMVTSALQRGCVKTHRTLTLAKNRPVRSLCMRFS